MTSLNDLSFIRVPTEELKFALAQYKKSLPDDQYWQLISDIHQLYLKFSNALSGYHPGADRARAAHRLIDEAMAQTKQVRSRCTKGCGACCHLEVEITQDEGELLGTLVTEGFSVDRVRLANQASRGRQDSEWKKMVQASNRCVFLGADSSCQIYDSRPLSCRKLLMQSDPTECMNLEGLPEPIFLPMAEIVFSAALSQPGNLPLSISKRVQEVLDRIYLPSAKIAEGRSDGVFKTEMAPASKSSGEVP